MSIPAHAKKVFSGVLFDTYQWQQEMYDGSFSTFEMLHGKPTVDLIATIGDKIITLEQAQPGRASYLSLVSGKIEEGQTPLETAEAELIQETGCTSSNIRLFKEFLGSSKIAIHEYVFIANDCQKITEQNLDGGEKIEVKLLSFDDFLQLCRHELFTTPQNLKLMMYEALIDSGKKEALRALIFNK